MAQRLPDPALTLLHRPAGPLAAPPFGASGARTRQTARAAGTNQRQQQFTILMTNVPWVGRYINLDRSPARRAEIEAELARAGLLYERFRAVDGGGGHRGKILAGEAGIWLSHIGVLLDHLGNVEPLHIVEDDAVLARYFVPTASRFVIDIMSRYDILMTDVHVPPDPIAYGGYLGLCSYLKDKKDFVCLDGCGSQIIKTLACTVSYFVNPDSVRKFVYLLRDGYNEGPQVPLDIFIRLLAVAGKLQVGIIFPFITSVRLDRSMDTSVSRPEPKMLRVLAEDIARSTFYADADLVLCRSYIDQFLPQDRDAHSDILAEVLRFTVNDLASQMR